MTAIASIDAECFVNILKDEGFREAGTDGERVVLEKAGVDGAPIIRLNTELSHTEILDWLEFAGIPLGRFIELRHKHCPP